LISASLTMGEDPCLTVEIELRAILIAYQDGCTEQQLIKDYAKNNDGEDIPYRTLGYGSLMELLKSMHHVAKINYQKHPPMIQGVPNENTKHIHDFVQGQGRKKKPKVCGFMYQISRSMDLLS
jgi:hypothetical protein